MSLFWAPADFSTEPEPLLLREGEQFATAWSPDGQLVAYMERDPTTHLDIWLLSIDDPRENRALLRTEANERDLAFAPPDGQWIAYSSDASGRYEVYVQPFPGPGERMVVSSDGGRAPRWAANGRELYYRQGDGLWAAPVQPEPTFDVGEPALLFEGPYGTDFDVDPRGRGFVMVKVAPPTEPSRFHVVLNWFTELEQLVPPVR